MYSVVTAVLGGGQGTRLWPLTMERAKPAVPVAGKFRLIDIPISNSLHARIDRIYVITQFNSASLHRHIAQTYRFDTFSRGYVNILAAEQGLKNRDWYQGTADAVRQNLTRLRESSPTEILILSGDQLYLMEMREFVRQHRRTEADLTIAVKPVSRAEAPELGIMRVDDSGQLTEFVEKPKDPADLDRLALDADTIARLGLNAQPGSLLASMGIYVFRPEVLKETLLGSSATDFGKEVIPQAIQSHRVFGFIHDGFWRDIGTIGSFHEANIELTAPLPAFDLYDPDFPMYTHPRFLPGSKIDRCKIFQSILADGSIISGASLARSILGIRAIVRSGSTIDASVVMGATHYEKGPPTDGDLPLGIGHDCHIRNSIIDINARIGDQVQLLNEAEIQEADGDNYMIRDGIIVVPRGAQIPSGTEI
jgi:glucose-1-phosphate adenylyltransferase